MIIIVDFGSQNTHLIQRRIQQLGASTKIVDPSGAVFAANNKDVSGVILSGGPSSVYESGAPTIDKKIFQIKVPILGICYGLQLVAHLMGGKVVSGRKEYGPVEIQNGKFSNKQMWEETDKKPESVMTEGLPASFTVWMSHGDEIVKLPAGYEIIASTKSMPFAFVINERSKIVGVQFHPEVEHTQYGTQILKNFLSLCNTKLAFKKKDIKEIEQEIKEEVGERVVIGAVSGGVDSTVAAALTIRAIGKQFIPVYVDNGLMRAGTTDHVKKIFTSLGVKPRILEVESEILKRLKGVTDPEKKRKIIGLFYIELFEKEMKKIAKEGKKVDFLLQGTIYSDVIESKGTKHAAKIKSHHNVGGLPKNMKLKLLEPLRNFYKDEVRSIGKQLGLPDEFVYKQPFPGPGYAVRIRGEITKLRLEKEKQADSIVLEELDRGNILSNVFLSFPVMTGAFSTAVKGDGRFFGEVVALRVVESKDIMTSTWSRLPYEVLQKISSRIVNEVPGISRVVYDITTKPPATMEWE